MKIPRDVTANSLTKVLLNLGYSQTRQVGSHIRFTYNKAGTTYHITIPNHNPIKIGTLNNILKDISHQTEISKEELIKFL